MSSKKWVLVFLVTVLVLAALLAALNLAADPFGAFGDRLMSKRCPRTGEAESSRSACASLRWASAEREGRT